MSYIALFNTYDRNKFREGHRRSIVRASTIAYSFNFNLILFNFPPTESLDALVKLCTLRTTVGERGKYLRKLAENGRIFIHTIKKGFPPQYAPIIATTSKPDERKKISTRDIAEMYVTHKKFTLLFGLGHRGLSRDILNSVDYHYEVTGKNLSLETCVAMGCVVGKIVGYGELLSE